MNEQENQIIEKPEVFIIGLALAGAGAITVLASLSKKGLSSVAKGAGKLVIKSASHYIDSKSEKQIN